MTETNAVRLPHDPDLDRCKMLETVLHLALNRAAKGKGKTRHGHGNRPFEEQPMLAMSRALDSIDGILYQILKKAIESKYLPPEEAINELLDIINYAAGGILYLRKTQKSSIGYAIEVPLTNEEKAEIERRREDFRHNKYTSPMSS